MRKHGSFVIAVLLTLSLTAYAQENKPFVLLRDSTALTHFCSRQGLAHVDGSWTPTPPEIEMLELRLASVSRLHTDGGSKDVEISQPGRYYRQYIPVVVRGRRLIYVNAFSSKPPSFWRKQLVDICDSGPQGWGVVYDPATGHFSDLQTNSMLVPPPPPPTGR